MRTNRRTNRIFFVGFFTALLVILIGTAHAAGPYWTFDAQPGVTAYKLAGGPAWMPASVPAAADGSMKLDVSAAAVGTTNFNAQACSTDPVWGEQCGSTLPFSFSRPAKPSTPIGGKLVP
jgi:hypothetical protein